jgi:hypothetical protein
VQSFGNVFDLEIRRGSKESILAVIKKDGNEKKYTLKDGEKKEIKL